jgi:lysozyme
MMALNRSHVAGGAIGATTGAVLTAAAAFIAPWEGLYTKPYTDVVGVRTVCFGETAADGVDLNRSYTPAECKALLTKSLPKYDSGIKACIHRAMPDSVHVVLISTAYNVGVHAVCSGSIARRANAGDWRGTCDALLAYNRGGGRVIKGLDNRRHAERARCLQDVT